MIVLRFYYGLTTSQIANELDCPSGSVGRWIDLVDQEDAKGTDMNELIDRLTDRLESLADTSDAHRDIDGVMAGTKRNRPETITARQSRRTLVQVAAVAIALAGVGGIIALTATQDSPGTHAPIETSSAPASGA